PRASIVSSEQPAFRFNMFSGRQSRRPTRRVYRGGTRVEIAFLGTGLMGEPMARRLLRAGHRVTAWNRTLAKAEPLAADGATVAQFPAAAVETAELVISILEDAAAVEDVLFARQAAESAPAGTLFIDMSSIAP